MQLVTKGGQVLSSDIIENIIWDLFRINMRGYDESSENERLG